MLLVKTYLDKSPIHGIGVFAAERIKKGTKIWRFVEGFDRCYTPKQFARLPKPARDFLKSYAYRVDGEILFTVDDDHYINHCSPRHPEGPRDHQRLSGIRPSPVRGVFEAKSQSRGKTE